MYAINRRALPLAATVVLVFGFAAYAAEPNTVTISNFAFSPAILSVAPGTKVVWANSDEEPHTVVSVGKKFPKSSGLDTDQEYSITAGAPGTYEYFCSVHPKMTGTIVVK